MPDQVQESAIPLPRALDRQLRALRKKLWRARGREWLGLAISLAILSFLFVWISDRLWDTPLAWRSALLALATATLAGIFSLYRWGYRHRDRKAQGKLVRRWDRRMGDRVLAAVELTGKQGETSGSPRLRRAAVDQLSRLIGQVDLSAAVDPTRARRGSVTMIALLLFAALLICLAPDAGINAARRCFLPWLSTDRYTFVQLRPVSGTRLVPYGETTSLRVELQPGSAWRRTSARALLRGTGRRLTAPLREDHYLFRLPAVLAEEVMDLTVGDARRRIRLLPKHRPDLVSLEATITLPEYLQHPPQHREIAGGRLAAVRGSRVILTGRITRPLASAGLRGSQSQPFAIQSEQFQSPPLAPSESPQVLELHWRDHLGLTPKEPLRIQLLVAEDQPPRIEVGSGIPRPLALLGSETVSLGLRAEDDFGLRSLGFLCGLPEAKPEDLWRQAQTHPVQRGHPEATSLRDELIFSPRTLGLEPATWHLWAYAQDYRPEALPAFSPAKVIRVLTGEEHASMTRAQFRQVREQLEAVAREESDLKQKNEALAQADSPAPESLKRQRLAEEANAAALTQLTERATALLQSACSNQSLGTGVLQPWAAMLGAMHSVAQDGMPQAALSLARARQAAASGHARSARAALGRAIAQQEENLQRLAAAMGRGQVTAEKLEAATFVNRLRKAATGEEILASTMRTSVSNSAGLAPHQLDQVAAKALRRLADQHDARHKEVDYLISDLKHYHRRTGKPLYAEVHRQMVSAKTSQELAELTQRVKNNQHGRVIRQALFWARQFHAWADALAKEGKSDDQPSTQDGSGETEGRAEMEMMLDIIRLTQREMTLRQQTRALHRQRETQGYAAAAEKLAAEQRDIGFALARLIPRALGPELQRRLREAARAIDDAAKLLAKPDTGGQTIAAESEVIELLAAAAKTSGQMGGRSQGIQALAELLAAMELGHSPGGNDSGDASALASRHAQGAASQDGRQARAPRKITGLAAGDFPEEFRQVLEHFFEQREKLRQQEEDPTP